MRSFQNFFLSVLACVAPAAYCRSAGDASCPAAVLGMSYDLLNSTFANTDQQCSTGALNPRNVDFAVESALISVMPAVYEQLLAALAFAHSDLPEAAQRALAILQQQADNGAFPHMLYNVEGMISNVAYSAGPVYPPCDVWHPASNVSSPQQPSSPLSSSPLLSSPPLSSPLLPPPLLSSAVLQLFYALYDDSNSGNSNSKSDNNGNSNSGGNGADAASEAIQFLAQAWQPLYRWHMHLADTIADTKGLFALSSPFESADVNSAVLNGYVLQAAQASSAIDLDQGTLTLPNGMSIQCVPQPIPDAVLYDAAWPNMTAYTARWCITKCAVQCQRNATCMRALCDLDFAPVMIIDNAILAVASQDLVTIMRWLQAAAPAGGNIFSGASRRLRTRRAASRTASFEDIAIPSISSDQAANVTLWASQTAAAVITQLCDAGQDDDGWCYDGIMHWQCDSYANVTISDQKVAVGALIGAISATSDDVSSKSLQAFKAAVANTILSDNFFPAPLLSSTSRISTLFSPSNGESGPVWAANNLAAVAGLAHPSNAGQFNLIVDAVKEDFSQNLCDSFDNTTYYHAFRADSGIPLQNATVHTNFQAASSTVLMLTGFFPVVPSPNGVAHLAYVVAVMMAEVIVVLLLGLSCVILGACTLVRLRAGGSPRHVLDESAYAIERQPMLIADAVEPSRKGSSINIFPGEVEQQTEVQAEPDTSRVSRMKTRATVPSASTATSNAREDNEASQPADGLMWRVGRAVVGVPAGMVAWALGIEEHRRSGSARAFRDLS